MHFVGCGYWGIVSNSEKGFCMRGDNAECSSDWTPDQLYSRQSLNEQYTVAFYWALVATTGIGYDVIPQTQLEHAYTIVCVVLGVFINAILIGSVPGAIENLDASTKQRKRELDTMNEYLRTQNVPQYLRKSVRNYFDYLHSCNYDQKIGEDLILQHLPDSLRMRIKVSVSIKSINRIPLFRDCASVCKIALIQRLRPKVAVPGEYLITQGEVGTLMFIIKRGRVQLKRRPDMKQRWGSAISRVILKRESFRKDEEVASTMLGGSMDGKSDDIHHWRDIFLNMKIRKSEPVIRELSDGDFFGEHSMSRVPHPTSALAIDYCDLLFLTSHDMEYVCKDYPPLKEILTSVGERREKVNVQTLHCSCHVLYFV